MTSYEKVYNCFLNSTTDFNLAELDDYTLRDMLKGWLHSAIIKVRTSNDLSCDDDIEAFNDEELETIKELYENGTKIGVKGLRIISKEEVLELEPNLSTDVVGALLAPTGGIVGPFEYTIALVENGIQNGGEIIAAIPSLLKPRQILYFIDMLIIIICRNR